MTNRKGNSYFAYQRLRNEVRVAVEVGVVTAGSGAQKVQKPKIVSNSYNNRSDRWTYGTEKHIHTLANARTCVL